MCSTQTRLDTAVKAAVSLASERAIERHVMCNLFRFSQIIAHLFYYFNMQYAYCIDFEITLVNLHKQHIAPIS